MKEPNIEAQEFIRSYDPANHNGLPLEEWLERASTYLGFWKIVHAEAEER